MAHSESDGTTGAQATTDTDGMRLVAREYDSTDDDGRVVEETTYTREEWWEDGPGARDAWTTLARQQTDNLDVRERDSEELVLIGVMGYLVNDDDEWNRMLDMGGFNGREWTYATVTPVDAVDEQVGHPDDPAPEAWAHDPLYDGTRRSLSLPRVQGEVGSGHSTRRKWFQTKYGYGYPKAAGLIVIHVEGEPSDLDRETLSHADGYPHDGEMVPDRSGEWSFDRMVTTARERLDAQQARQQHQFDVNDRVDDLADHLEETAGEDAIPPFGAAVLSAFNAGRREYRDAHDDVGLGEDLDPATRDSIYTAAEAAVKNVVDAADGDEAALVDALSGEEGDEEGSDE